MRKIVSGIVLREKIRESVDLLSDTVKCTLGPKGNNVIIDHSLFTPFITNDGVTIAQNIESDDEVVNTILEIAKEASIKTNEIVGDGTTTTIVLLQSLLNLSYDVIEKGESPIILKNKLNEVLGLIVEKLSENKTFPDGDTIKNVVKVSSQDERMAEVLGEVLKYVSYKESIIVTESDDNNINYSYFKGYSLPVVMASPFFLSNNASLNFKDSLVLIINSHLDNIECISEILNDVMKNNRNIIIVANSYSDYFVNNIVSLVLDGVLNCVLVRINEYGLRNGILQKDLEILCDCKAVQDVNNIVSLNFGRVKNAFISSDSIRFDFLQNKRIKNYISELENEDKSVVDSFEREFLRKRISMFYDGIVEIKIGAPTKLELREKRMRLDDAICALFSAKEGVLPGGGVSLLKVMSELQGEDECEKIWKETLKKPFEQILFNAGLSFDEIYEKIKNSEFNLIYNVHTSEFESVTETTIVDPFNVIIKSLINACSIASMLITTSSLVINDHDSNLNKVTDYNEG